RHRVDGRSTLARNRQPPGTARQNPLEAARFLARAQAAQPSNGDDRQDNDGGESADENEMSSRHRVPRSKRGRTLFRLDFLEKGYGPFLTCAPPSAGPCACSTSGPS